MKYDYQKRLQSESGSMTLKLDGLNDLTSVNKLLMVLTAIVIALFILNVVVEAAKLGGAGHFIKSMEKNQSSSNFSAYDVNSSTETAAHNLASSAMRNIFIPAPDDVVAEAGEVVAINPSHYYELVGISKSDSRDENYAMVENTKTQMTYVLKYGQEVEGLELIRILDEKVVLKIGGKKVELE